VGAVLLERAARAVKTFTMLQSFLSRAALVFLSGSLAVLSVACGENKWTTGNTAGNHESVSVGNWAAIQRPNKKPGTPSASRKPHKRSRSLDQVLWNWLLIKLLVVRVSVNLLNLQMIGIWW
jgi:hypothetical protein